jgi:hypothetical protein
MLENVQKHRTKYRKTIKKLTQMQHNKFSSKNINNITF